MVDKQTNCEFFFVQETKNITFKILPHLLILFSEVHFLFPLRTSLKCLFFVVVVVGGL